MNPVIQPEISMPWPGPRRPFRAFRNGTSARTPAAPPGTWAGLSLSDNPNTNALSCIYDCSCHYARLDQGQHLMAGPPVAGAARQVREGRERRGGGAGEAAAGLRARPRRLVPVAPQRWRGGGITWR